MSAPPRGRFAPTPSGALHLGNLRTALIAWVAARHDGGEIVVRIDDLDPATARTHHEVGQLADLAALGLRFDGEVVRQSTRRDAHRGAVEQLRALGVVYPCFCSRAEVHAALSAPNAPIGVGYPGTCAALDTSQVERRLGDASRPPAWRVRTDGSVMTFTDVVHGRVAAATDDFVVQRSDGLVAYHVAAVVDDAMQGITQVVRGDDLLDSTPRQRWLQQMLELPEPTYAHVPLVVGPDRARLAKRHGSVTMSDLAALGVASRRVLALLGASLGWCGPDDGRHVPALLEAFVADFRFSDLPREPWVLQTSLS